jgi:putative sigma-54 modulation protein
VRVLMHPRTISTDDKKLRAQVVESLQVALGPVRSYLHGADLYLTDVNGPKGGPGKRCRVVAYLPAGRPVVVSRTDRDPVAAVTAAAARCRRSIRSQLKRRQDRRRRAVAA